MFLLMQSVPSAHLFVVNTIFEPTASVWVMTIAHLWLKVKVIGQNVVSVTPSEGNSNIPFTQYNRLYNQFVKLVV